MKKLGEGLNELMVVLGSADEATRMAARSAEVNVHWRTAVEAVYKDAADLVLDHINAVYVMAPDEVVGGRPTAPTPDGGTVLVVYSDDSLIRSDLDARQEFLKMKLKEQGERVETFKIMPSRFEMKARHPFRRDKDDVSTPRFNDTRTPPEPLEALTPDERAHLESQVSSIENSAVRTALLKAMAADLRHL